MLGMLAGIALAVGLRYGTNAGILLAGAMLILPVMLLKQGALFWTFLLSILIFEEFPSGEGETVERAIRNPFYGQSLGVPGMYAPDLMVGLILLLAVVSILLERRPTGLRLDRIALWLTTISATVLFSVLLSFITENPQAYGVIQEASGTGYQVNERGAQLIAFFQLKNFALLVLAYVAALIHLRDTSDMRRFVNVVGIAAACWLALGLYRLALHPEWVTNTLPLFYDSQSSWLFALVVFYVAAAWALDLLPPRRFLLLSLLCACMAVFVLVSFRRTMWAAIMLGTVILMLWLPAGKRNRLLAVGILLAGLLGGLLLASPAGDLVVKALLTRVEQTDIQDASTVYRLALFVHFAEHFDEIPFFGYGARPLWNEFVQLGYFRTNLENIHSLYFWLLLRLGYFGFTLFVAGVVMVLVQAWQLARHALQPEHRILALMVLLALVMFLFSGIFNPVYAQPRYMVILGAGLALLSRISWLNRTYHGSKP